MSKTVVVIPALNPLRQLVNYIHSLKMIGIDQIIVINDGSDEKYIPIFSDLATLKYCTVLEHKENKGKGRALKTAFEYILKNGPYIEGVITVGAHNQHELLEVHKMINATKVFSDGIILGVRNFHSYDGGLSRFIGNRAASMLFELFFHKRLLDTQTGLRYIPKQELHWLKNVPGEKFDYDTNMLIEAINRKVNIYEIPIGKLKLKKNSIIYYDEIVNTGKVLQQIFMSFLNNRKL